MTACIPRNLQQRELVLTAPRKWPAPRAYVHELERRDMLKTRQIEELLEENRRLRAVLKNNDRFRR